MKLQDFLDDQVKDLTKKKSEKAWQFDKRVTGTKNSKRSSLEASIKNTVMAYIRSMFDLRLKFAKETQDTAPAYGNMPSTNASGLYNAVK